MSCDTERGHPILVHYRVSLSLLHRNENTSLLMFSRLPRYPLPNKKATLRNPLGSRRSRGRSPWLCSSGEAKSSRPSASVESTDKGCSTRTEKDLPGSGMTSPFPVSPTGPPSHFEGQYRAEPVPEVTDTWEERGGSYEACAICFRA